MSDFHTLVPLPAITDINSGLSPASQRTMLAVFGRPGRLTRDCSPVTNVDLKERMATRSVGPFTVTGWTPALDSLSAIFGEVNAKNSSLYAVVRTAGMLCCRAVRGSTANFSNHSWGTAIDLKIESELDELGADHVQKGILDLYPYFHRHGWFWAAGYHDRKDPMHFEMAEETIRRMTGH